MVTGHPSCDRESQLNCSPRHNLHHTAKWSAPSPGGITRLCADDNDKMVRDWFRDQVLGLGLEYKVAHIERYITNQRLNNDLGQCFRDAICASQWRG
jgi:hypothetical protein